MSGARPFMSVIVPAHNAEGVLPDVLSALVESDLDRTIWELIVVDDASSDGTVTVAAKYADEVVRLSGYPHGPAFARNRGSEVARGEVLLFVDSDVRLAPDALRKVERAFRQQDATLGALFGSYDRDPPAAGIVSRYRNLLHHYHHHHGAGEAETFWAGLGAVRTGVFTDVGGFDEIRYARPQIEDIELGRRIRRSGHRILLDPTIQGAHLKRWTLGQVVRTDLLHRGIPWMRLLLEEGGGGGTLNVKPKEKLCVALVGLSLLALTGSVLTGSGVALITALVSILLVVVLNIELYRYLSHGRGLWFAVALVPLHLIYYLTSGLAFLFGHLAHRLSPHVPRSASVASESR